MFGTLSLQCFDCCFQSSIEVFVSNPLFKNVRNEYSTNTLSDRPQDGIKMCRSNLEDGCLILYSYEYNEQNDIVLKIQEKKGTCSAICVNTGRDRMQVMERVEL